MRSSKKACAAMSAAAIIAATAAISVLSAAREDTDLTTTIESATIYSGIARVTRTGRIDVKKGLYRIVCGDLPAGFEESSLKVEGEGTARATILGIDIVELPGEVSETPKYRELKKRLDSMESARDSLQIIIQTLDKRQEFVTQFGSQPFKERKDQEPLDVFRVDDWKNLMDFLDEQRILVERKLYHVGMKSKKILEEIEWIKTELNTMRATAKWKKLVVIECEAESPGYLDLDLTYTVSNAAWNPEYRARYAATSETIELTYNARVRQVTGEDWNDVSVILSTARPQIGAAPPELTPYYISYRPSPPLGYYYDDEGKLQETIVGRSESVALKSGLVKTGDELHVRGGASAYTPPAAPIARAEMTSESSDFATNLAIKKTVDLESGADPKRVAVLQKEITGELSRITVPRLSPNVFIRGSFENTLGVPILAGAAEVYIETPGPGGAGSVSNFVGKEVLSSVVAGEEFELHLGADQDMKVEHERVKKERLTKQGAKTTKIRYTYKITLESFKKDSVEVTVQDRIPVSDTKEIKVEDVDLEPRPGETQENGILTWIIAMTPGGKREISIAYTISFPGDWPEQRLTIE